MMSMQPLKKQQGAVVISIVVVLLFFLAWLGYAMIQSERLAQKASGNSYRAAQAWQAAQAGLEFGILYLGKNKSTIVVNNGNGYIAAYSDSNTNNVALTNGSHYTITYSNPVQNNLTTLLVDSVGTSADGSSTREIRQLVTYTPTLTTFGTTSLVVVGNVSMSGNSSITNTSQNSTIKTGGTITLNSNSQTVTSGGVSSTHNNLKSDVSQNNASLSSLSATQFFATYFGASSSSVQSSAQYSYTNSSNTNYDSALNGKTGTVIWITQTGGTTATIDGNTTIGSAASPVILIVNGNLSMAGNAIIYGFVYVTGNLQSGAGNASIQGALAVNGNDTDSGNFNITYNTTALTNAQSIAGSYGKVPGGWNDIKE